MFFNYQKGRGRNGPKTLLKDFKGYLQTDGYIVYDKIAKALLIELLGCMAHARRYFFEARDSDPKRAEKALQFFRQLYRIERQIKEQDLNIEQIKAVRQEKSKPVLEALIQWAKEEKAKVLPKSPIDYLPDYAMAQTDQVY